MIRIRSFSLAVTSLLALTALAWVEAAVPIDRRFVGAWELQPERSSDVEPWRSIRLNILLRDGQLVIRRNFWAGRYQALDSLVASLEGREIAVAVAPGKWHELLHVAAYVPEGDSVRCVLRSGGSARQFAVHAKRRLQVAQGITEMSAEYRFRVSADGRTLWLTLIRDSRPTPVTLVFRRID